MIAGAIKPFIANATDGRSIDVFSRSICRRIQAIMGGTTAISEVATALEGCRAKLKKLAGEGM